MRWTALGLAACLAASCASEAPLQMAGGACDVPTVVTRFPIEGAIGVRWSAAAGMLAFGRQAGSDRFDTWLSDREGGSARRLTSAAWREDRHQFPIAWHPSGKWLVMLVEHADHGGNGWDSTPGYGAHSDYWIVRPDGSDARVFVQMPGDNDHALTHASFSADGSRFVWTERIKAPQLFNAALGAGSYRFNVADVVERPFPHLANIRSIVPRGKEQGGEVETIGADNRTIYFWSTIDSGNFLASRLYSMDIDSGAIRQLTTEGFAQAPTLTADGRRIIYMTDAHPDAPGAKVEGADWWIMDLDGGSKQRLTWLSVHGSPQSNGGRQLAGSISVIDGHSFYGDVLTNLLGLTGYIAKVEFKPGCVS